MTTKFNSHWDAEHYNKHSQYQYVNAMKLIGQINWRGNEHVLDIGCGDGKLTYEISKRLPHGKVLGVDSSESMIRFANAHFGNYPNLSFQFADAQTLTFQNSFDKVVSFFCLHWVADKLAAFKGIHSSLKENGTATILASLRQPIIDRVNNAMLVSQSWQPYFVNYDDPIRHVKDTAYEKYLAQAGFLLEETQTINYTIPFEQKQDMLNFLTAITPYLSHLPDKILKERFIAELADGYLKECSPSHSPYEITYTYVVYFAKK